MATLVEAAGLLADALQVKFAEAAADSTVKTTKAVVAWQYAHAAAFTTSAQNHKPDEPAWEWLNPRKADIALKRLELAFNDKPDGAAYVPHVLVTINNVPLFESDGNAFQDNDLTLDLDGGVRLKLSESVKVYIWNEGSTSGTRKVTASLKVGAA